MVVKRLLENHSAFQKVSIGEIKRREISLEEKASHYSNLCLLICLTMVLMPSRDIEKVVIRDTALESRERQYRLIHVWLFTPSNPLIYPTEGARLIM